MSFVSHIECTICGHHHDATRTQTVCEKCGQMLAVRYDLERVKRSVTKDALRSRPPGMYRFRELTPLADGETPVTLGEGGTPLLPLPRLAAHLGLRHLWGKDEGQNPTGSFKARGLGMAITQARTLGARGFIIPSAGNAGGAAARVRRALRTAVRGDRAARHAAGGHRRGGHRGRARLHDRGLDRDRRQGRGPKVAPELGWFDLSTLKEPYRLEGKKTMGLELAEQLDWTMPDVLLYPTGGGTGLVGIPKGYEELRAMGWVSGALPRFFAVQAEGCAPMVKAFHAGRREHHAVGEPHDPRGGAAGALAVRRSSDAAHPARVQGRGRRGERARHDRGAAPAGPTRGHLDVARGGGADCRAGSTQGRRPGDGRRQSGDHADRRRDQVHAARACPHPSI